MTATRRLRRGDTATRRQNEPATPPHGEGATGRQSAPTTPRHGDAAARRLVVAAVIEELPNLVYRVEVEGNKARALAHAVGSVKRNFVRLVPGDRVEMELSPHDLTRGRILRKIVHEGSRIGKEDLR